MSAQRLVMWVLCALVCLSICSHFTARAAWDCPPCSQMSPCSRDDDVVKARDACAGGVVYEPCGCCKVCAKVEGESCAGPYVSEGRCDGDLRCTVSEEHSLKGKLNETGICLPKICFKNCTRRAPNPTCGSDGRWYRNNCARRKHNCGLSNYEKVKLVSNDSICNTACGDLSTSEHINVNYSDGILHKSIATFNCDLGYMLVNPLVTTARCVNGSWTAVTPICKRYNPCDNIRCSAGARCVSSNASCVCKSLDECPQDKGHTVCGSDGRTYPSRCHLQVTACKNQTSVIYKHKGKCPETPSDTTASTQGSLSPPHTGDETSRRSVQ